jgi:predicted outer membrane repeat protein
MKTKRFSRSVVARLLGRVFLAATLVLLVIGPGSPAVLAAGTLQTLIDNTPAGGTASVPAGTYTEYVTINKNLTLQAASGAVVILQPPSGHTAISLVSGASTVTLRNLTIQNASNDLNAGGGVIVSNGALTVDHCTFSNNSASTGGAIFLDHGSLSVSNSSILNNHSTTGDGGGIFANGPLTLTNTLVKNNTAGRHGGGVHGNAGLVTITGGSFENNHANGGNGGGLNMNDDLTINGAVFTGNSSTADGGGVLQWNTGRQIHLTNVTFTDNISKRAGGGMAAKGNMTVEGGSFLRNYAGDTSVTEDTLGGGLYLEGGTLDLDGTTFESNEARRSPGGFTQGGGLYAANPAANQVSGAVFTGNKAWLGGGIYKTKRNSDTSYGSLTLLSSSFINNEAGYGGAVDTYSLTVRDSLFDGNTANNQGGALDLGGNTVIERVRFLNNKTTYQGGKGAGLYLSGNVTLRNSAFVGNFNTSANARGSALMLAVGTGVATLEHLTISNNTGGNGAGLQVEGGTVTMTNSIIASQVVGVCQTGGALSISGVLWSGNTGNTTGTDCTLTPSVDHAISGSAAFAADGYHITSTSFAYNTAYNSLLSDDIDGNPRPSYGQADLGADEYWLFHLWLPVLLK